jgi:cytosine/adenosine deaminase-related metal-dependent hydrolase
LFPVDAEPIENGTIETDSTGRIVARHARDDPRAENLGNVAVIPGLVNAHTHLEFSGRDSPLSSGEPFTDWIRAVVAWRRGGSSNQAADVRCGLSELAVAGTTLVGEIAAGDWSLEQYSASGPRAVLFQELIGLLPEQREEQLVIARRHLSDGQVGGTGRLLAGLSPHAPYSVHPQLFGELVDLANTQHAPLAIHLAETAAELELLDRGTGPFVELLREFGVWREDVIPSGSRPLDYLRRLEPLQHALVIHGNYLSDEEIDFLSGHENLAVVYCPRTHAYFGHREHPWRKLIASGARVAVGTDGRASNPDLSLWRELCFLRKHHPQVDARKLLELGTIDGARALGLDAETGSLTIGKRADLTVVSLDARTGSDPYAVLIDDANRIVGTMCDGCWIHRSF